METTANEIDFSELMNPTVMAGGGLATVCFIVGFILWIITLVKQFKGGDTVWGVLTIFFNAIPAIIWSFMKGRKGLGILWVLVAIGFIVCILGFGSLFKSIIDQSGAA